VSVTPKLDQALQACNSDTENELSFSKSQHIRMGSVLAFASVLAASGIVRADEIIDAESVLSPVQTFDAESVLNPVRTFDAESILSPVRTFFQDWSGVKLPYIAAAVVFADVYLFGRGMKAVVKEQTAEIEQLRNQLNITETAQLGGSEQLAALHLESAQLREETQQMAQQFAAKCEELVALNTTLSDVLAQIESEPDTSMLLSQISELESKLADATPASEVTALKNTVDSLKAREADLLKELKVFLPKMGLMPSGMANMLLPSTASTELKKLVVQNKGKKATAGAAIVEETPAATAVSESSTKAPSKKEMEKEISSRVKEAVKAVQAEWAGEKKEQAAAIRKQKEEVAELQKVVSELLASQQQQQQQKDSSSSSADSIKAALEEERAARLTAEEALRQERVQSKQALEKAVKAANAATAAANAAAIPAKSPTGPPASEAQQLAAAKKMAFDMQAKMTEKGKQAAEKEAQLMKQLKLLQDERQDEVKELEREIAALKNEMAERAIASAPTSDAPAAATKVPKKTSKKTVATTATTTKVKKTKTIDASGPASPAAAAAPVVGGKKKTKKTVASVSAVSQEEYVETLRQFQAMSRPQMAKSSKAALVEALQLLKQGDNPVLADMTMSSIKASKKDALLELMSAALK